LPNAVLPLGGARGGAGPPSSRHRRGRRGDRPQGDRSRLECPHLAGRRGGPALIHALYSVALRLGLLAYLPVFALRKLRRGGYDGAIGQRLGRYGADLPVEARCWIHPLPVGEAATAVPLVEALARRWPELGIVMTTGRQTGGRIVADRLAW